MYSLQLKDGVYWNFIANSPQGKSVLKLLVGAMRLSNNHKKRLKNEKRSNPQTQIISMNLVDSEIDIPLERIPCVQNSIIEWPLLVHRHPRMTFINAFIIAQLIGVIAENYGGILIHGALIEMNGNGIILAGPSGAGKSTACNRLPSYWNSLSDDAVLVTMKSNREYWAHPWPTWSRVNAGDPSGFVDSGKPVSLAGICFLQKAQNDAIEKLEKRNALGKLLGCAEVATGSLFVELTKSELIKLRQRRFDNLYNLVSSIPQYSMKIYRRGNFWQILEETIITRSSKPINCTEFKFQLK